MGTFLLIIGLAIFVFWVCGVRSNAQNRARKAEQARAVAAKVEAMKAAALRGVSIGLGDHYQRTSEDERFESIFLENWKSKIDKHFFTAVAGVTFANPDGVNRQSLISRCEPYNTVKLNRDYNNPGHPDAVKVLNEADQVLGYLHEQQASQITADFEGDARVWMAIVRQVTPKTDKIPHGLTLCLFRLSEEFVNDQVAAVIERAGKVADKPLIKVVRASLAAGFMAPAG